MLRAGMVQTVLHQSGWMQRHISQPLGKIEKAHTMSTFVETKNKELFLRWFDEVWNKGRVSAIETVVDTNFPAHTAAGGQPVAQGPAGVLGLVQAWRTAFPDGQMIVDEVIAEGEFVGSRRTMHGTHLGNFYTVPPSGKRVEMISFGINRFVDGKLVERWGEVDMVGLLQQIGGLSLLPVPSSSAQASSGSLGTAAMPAQAPSSSSTSADNKAILRRYNQAISEGDWKTVSEVVDIEHYVQHNFDFNTGVTTFEESVQRFAAVASALPDLRYSTHLVIAERDFVLARRLFTATHVGGELFGVAPTGKKIEWTGMDMYRIQDGKIVECWLCGDILRVLQQLGLVAPLSS